MTRRKKIFIGLGIFFAVVLVAYGSLFFITFHSSSPQIIGATFDPAYANYLGVNPEAAFKTIIGDWGFKYIRLPVHWNEVEPSSSQFDFSLIDPIVRLAEQNHVKLIIAVGQKTPRWPECHIPDWAAKLGAADYQKALHAYMAAVVERYRSSPAVEMWQVENEAFVDFGNCPKFTPAELQNEIGMVKGLDMTHPTITSDSGELSTWSKTAHAADYFGTTIYRTIWNKYLGYWHYFFIPPAFYRIKLALTGRSVAQAFILEMQAEPWLPGTGISGTPLNEQYQSMNVGQLESNIAFAKNTGFPRVYLWGAEWWYYLAVKGQNAIPDYIKQLPK